ncbi:MAG: pyruvate ferredoxin oxidoreductase subunit gamma [Thermoplasmata archaeon]|nr:MAG: pyruvate ferredoxin oxidoreductase subunit gamma [Thermoplasmata archaeon]
MNEIRIHGRGGQGSVTAAELLAQAAFKDGNYSQAFPAFGVERRGAPVQAFCRIDDKKIRTRAQIYFPDIIIVQDSTLLEVVDVFSGLKDDGMAVINTKFEAEDLEIDHSAQIITVDATGLAIEHLGRPITNTVMLGAFAGATGLVNIDSLVEMIRDRFPGEMGEKNVAAIRDAYTHCGGEECSWE